MGEITFPDNTTYESNHNENSCRYCHLNEVQDKCNAANKQSNGCFNIVWKRKENTEIQEELKAIESEAYIQAIHDKYKEESKYKHYFKDVSHLETIDVYRVLDLWKVTHPCLQHALKKILVAGDRGYKDVAKDIQEAIDSLERWKEMQEENL